MRRYGVALGLLVAGCGFRYEATAPRDPVEESLLAETARAAGAIQVNVHGEITDTISSAQITPDAPAPVAWYSGGIAWYYRPQVVKYVSLGDEPGKVSTRNIATHEVCHALSRRHDLPHWECMNKYAVPTYPRPGSAKSAANSAQVFCRFPEGQ